MISKQELITLLESHLGPLGLTDEGRVIAGKLHKIISDLVIEVGKIKSTLDTQLIHVDTNVDPGVIYGVGALKCDIKDCRKKAVVFDTPHNLCEEHKNLCDSENGTARWIG